MIGKIFKIGFYCSNPVGETWYHNLWKLFTPFEYKYFPNKVHGEPFIIEVNKGYIRGSAIALIHGQVEYRKVHFRAEIWQKLTMIG